RPPRPTLFPYTTLFRSAQAHWSRFLLLGAPVSGPDSGSVAQIDLGTRQVSLDLRLVREKKLADCVEAILAHEVGHHVRYPGTLADRKSTRLNSSHDQIS